VLFALGSTIGLRMLNNTGWCRFKIKVENTLVICKKDRKKYRKRPSSRKPIFKRWSFIFLENAVFKDE